MNSLYQGFSHSYLNAILFQKNFVNSPFKDKQKESINISQEIIIKAQEFEIKVKEKSNDVKTDKMTQFDTNNILFGIDSDQ